VLLGILGVMALSGCKTAAQSGSAEPETSTEVRPLVAAPVPEVAEHEPEPAPASEPAPEVALQGALDRDVIRGIVRANIEDVRACYNIGLKADPQLQGRVAIEFLIAGDGRIASALVSESTLTDVAVPACIARAIADWVFPKPAGGGTVTVTYPFNLVPG
jgi:outer membrane biosynthesis protein TonB